MFRSLSRLVLLLPLLAACASPANEGSLNRVPAFAPGSAAPPPAIASDSNDLTGAVWLWQGTQQGSAPVLAPAGTDRYSLAFQGGGRVNLRADCNRGTGPYAINGSSMKMGPFALTKMMCAEGSRDGEFLRDLERVATYGVTRGQLNLTLPDGSVMRFSRQP